MTADRRILAPASARPRAAWLLPAIGVIGLAISAYLTITKLAGGSPVCGPLQGCETVDASPYSSILGIPTAAFGLLYSGAYLVATVGWIRRGERRLLLGAYLLGLIGVLLEAYLVYLQLAVIHAVCIWCAAYGLTVLAGFVAVVIELRRGDRPPGTADRGRG
ncbi:MAG: vitamin K epoxide reductase family protein [Candidatus Limnocylindrales bacterium]